MTHALITTPLTDRSGATLGDALSLVGEVDTVKGEMAGAPGDHQFRIYVRLVDGALERLDRSQQFKRGLDNSIYHQGYPISYRAQGGVPSIQISIALDKRRADIDVDYRSSIFPVSLVNGHLSASNSDVRAGNNFDRHGNRWIGLQNWWGSFLGVRQERAPEETASANPLAVPTVPRAGKATIEVMVHDFLNAWLVEGDIMAAMGYVSARSYACLARESDDPSNFDRGLAPFQLMMRLKAAHDSLGPRKSLDGLVVGTRLARPGLRVVRQPYHAQFVIYSVPDDIAASLDCESQLTPGDPASAKRVYGTYFGATFNIDGPRNTPTALLWARENGFWKIASWKVVSDDATTAAPEKVAATTPVRIAADPTLVQAARGFLEAWLIRRDWDAAFAYLSPQSYGCYDLERSPDKPPSTSPEDAGRQIRAGFETFGALLGPVPSLEGTLTAAEPAHPAIRVMNHPDSRIFTLSSFPNALSDAVECAARASGTGLPDPLPLELRKRLRNDRALQDPQRGRTRAAAVVAQGEWLVADHVVLRRAALSPAPSSANRRALASSPAANPVSVPVDPMTRWHGAMIDTGFRPFAAPTARAAPGLPICFAISP